MTALTTSPKSGAVTVHGHLVDALRRDLIGPGPVDTDLFDERLDAPPSRWYLAGFLAPAPNGETLEGDAIEDTGDPLFGADEGADPETGGGRAADDTPDDEPTRKVRLPSSCGLTVLVDASVTRTRSPAEPGRLRYHSPASRGSVPRRGSTIRPCVAEAAMAAYPRRGDGQARNPANGRAEGIPVPDFRRPPAPRPRLDRALLVDTVGSSGAAFFE